MGGAYGIGLAQAVVDTFPKSSPRLTLHRVRRSDARALRGPLTGRSRGTAFRVPAAWIARPPRRRGWGAG